MADDEVSPKCKVRLAQPPDCADAKSMRSYALCWARYEGQKQGLAFGPSLKQGWVEAKKSCQVAT